MKTRAILAVAAVFAVLALASVQASTQTPHSQGPGAPAGGSPHAHGTPAGGQLAWPAGDVARGRHAFEKFECGSCHEVKGERFAALRDPQSVGPELSQMGPLHDALYFVEAIVNPSATIESGQGYAAADGSSKMPSYHDSMTVQELIDLVAFLRSLRPPAGGPGSHGQPAAPAHQKP
jgi:cytochrome c553